MTECVQFFSADGDRIEKFPIWAPQYKVVMMQGDRYKWYRLNKDCMYDEKGEGCYQEVLYRMLVDSRRVNAKKLKLNWNNCADLAGTSVLYESALKTSPVGTAMYLTIEGKACQTSSVAAWKIVKEDKDWYGVYRPYGEDTWLKVYEEQLYSCKQFTDDQEKGIHDRLIELYRCNRGLHLYRYVAMLKEFNTESVLVGVTLQECVEGAINYTASWTNKAIRIGSKCIERQGLKTNLARPKDCLNDWSVTQLSHLCRLDRDEVEFLVERGALSPIMSGDEVWGVVKDYLEDPDRKMMRAYRAHAAGVKETAS